MIKPEETINSLKNKLKPLLGDHLGFHEVTSFPKVYNLCCGYCSDAITRGEEVKIVNLFDNYWIYMKIVFQPYEVENNKTTMTNYYIMFSLSVFYGEYSDKLKKQLFRAEWDNYENDDSSHPQPHWHFYIDNQNENLQTSFSEIIDGVSDGFTQVIANENKEFQKMHFAMNGQWSNKEGHLHKIEDSEDFIKWAFGLIEHISTQLKYIERT